MEIELTLIYIMAFTIGIMIGSFLNVVIYRLPKGNFWDSNRSYCPNCKQQLKAYDLVPIFSYLVLGGKCRSCKQKISVRYALIELFTGLMAVASVWRFGFDWQALLVFGVVAVCIAITMIDFDIMEIPDSLNIAIAVLAIGSIFIDKDITLLQRIIGFFIISLPMLLSVLVIPSAFGGGDIKLIAAAGLLLGFANVVLAMFIAILLGGGLATYLTIMKRVKKRTINAHIAFGPYICVGIVTALFWGNELINWYIGFFR